MNERHPKDPRNNPNHREHGAHFCRVTYEDIAKATGLALGTVRAYAAGRRRRFSLRDAASVLTFVLSHRVARVTRDTDARSSGGSAEPARAVQ